MSTNNHDKGVFSTIDADDDDLNDYGQFSFESKSLVTVCLIFFIKIIINQFFRY